MSYRLFWHKMLLAASIYKVCDILEGQVVSGFSESTSEALGRFGGCTLSMLFAGSSTGNEQFFFLEMSFFSAALLLRTLV